MISTVVKINVRSDSRGTSCYWSYGADVVGVVIQYSVLSMLSCGHLSTVIVASVEIKIKINNWDIMARALPWHIVVLGCGSYAGLLSQYQTLQFTWTLHAESLYVYSVLYLDDVHVNSKRYVLKNKFFNVHCKCSFEFSFLRSLHSARSICTMKSIQHVRV